MDYFAQELCTRAGILLINVVSSRRFCSSCTCSHKKLLILYACKPSWPRPRPRRLCRVWKFGVIGKLLSGKEVQSSRAREKLGKALWTPLIPTRPLPSKSFPFLLPRPSLNYRRLRLRNVFHDRKKLPKVALPSYPAAVHRASP